MLLAKRNDHHSTVRLLIATLCLVSLLLILVQVSSVHSLATAKDDCEQCGPTRLIGCRSGRCYYKCTRRCLGKDNKFYYEALKFNFAGQR